MSLRTQWPYAANAIVRHEWVVNLLNVWVTFKFTMDQDVKPAHGLWICKVDGVLKAITVSAWQDEWTILLTVPNVLALPGRVTLEYDGPSADLRITWDKQWEPWGPILSVRVPYLWEDILVVDAVNKRVGIQPGVVAAAAFGYAFTIISPDGTEQIGIYHDNGHSHCRWTKGAIRFESDEATNHDTKFEIQGAGTGYGELWVYGPSKTSSIYYSRRYLSVGGVHPHLSFQYSASVPVYFFEFASEGETENVYIRGRRAGDSLRRLGISISPNANNTALFSGVGDYTFNGTVNAIGGFVDNGVPGIDTTFLDADGNTITVSGGIITAKTPP